MSAFPSYPLPWSGIAEAAPALQHVRDTRLGQVVRDEVLARILAGELAPGDRISEPEIAARLGVSRVPVREALRELQATGLVETRKHAGAFVRRLGAAEIADLYELRATLDAFAARRVAARPSAALLGALDDTLAAMEAAAQRGDVADYYAHNLRLHWTIVDAAGNDKVRDVYRQVVQQLHVVRLRNLSSDAGMPASTAEHRAIVAAIRDADPERCERLVAAHVASARARLAAQT